MFPESMMSSDALPLMRDLSQVGQSILVKKKLIKRQLTSAVCQKTKHSQGNLVSNVPKWLLVSTASAGEK